MPTHPLRIGLLGGTFDPIHYGHVRLGESIASTFHFDELLYIPAYSPPHKAPETITPAYHRYAMTVLATLHAEKARVSAVEIVAPEKPYTVETMTHLRDEYGPQAHLFFLMGADSFMMLEKWYQFRTLIDLCHIIVMTRPGYNVGDSDSHLARFGAGRVVDLRDGGVTTSRFSEVLQSGTHIFLTDFVALDISATEIRTAVSEGRSIAAYVPPLVERYIYTYKLYSG